MPIFLEKYLLPLAVALTVLLVFTNPMNFDWQQRISAGIALVASAFFVGHTLQKINHTSQVQQPVRTAQQSPSQQDPEIPQSLPPLAAAQPEPKTGKSDRAVAFKEAAPSAMGDAKNADRSVKIGDKNQIINSPIVTGDGNTVSVGTPRRSLSDRELTDLADVLAPFPGQPVHLLTGFFDGEGQHYAKQFNDVFKSAKWNVVEFMFQDNLPKGTEIGLWMGIRDKNNQPPAALALGRYLMGTLHLSVQGIEFTDAKDGHVYLIVGLKP